VADHQARKGAAKPKNSIGYLLGATESAYVADVLTIASVGATSFGVLRSSKRTSRRP
jgi:hypothetical protein